MTLVDFIEKHLFKMQPNEVMTDYEEGMRLAIKQRWPDVELHGCWFHFCRAIRKRLRKFAKFLNKNRNAQAVQRAMMCIPLLPPELIDDGVDSVKKMARLFTKLNNVFSYFDSFWMKKVLRQL